jgi:hypothetical protein
MRAVAISSHYTPRFASEEWRWYHHKLGVDHQDDDFAIKTSDLNWRSKLRGFAPLGKIWKSITGPNHSTYFGWDGNGKPPTSV